MRYGSEVGKGTASLMGSKSSEINASLMAEKLKVLKNTSAKTSIFLGAKAGALFRSQHLYEKLRGFNVENLYGFPLLERFSRSYGILTNNFSTDEIQGILVSSELLEEIRPEVPELCVAQLMKASIFKYVLSTSVHKEFEQAFEQMGMKRNRDFNMYWPKKHGSIPSVAANQQELFTFYKLFGDVHDGCTIKDRLDYMKGYKDLERIANELREVNMLIIGLDSTWDRDIIPALFPRSDTTTTWYVNDEAPPDDSPLHDYLKECKAKQVLGFDGRYESIVRDLCWHITGNVPVNQEMLGLLVEIKKELQANQRTLQKLSEETDNLKIEVQTNQQTLQKLSEETEGLHSELSKLRGRTRKNKTEER